MADESSPRTAQEIVERLRTGGPALVALSGGVDSAAVASLAYRALGAAARAATVVSASVSAEELASTRAVVRRLGIPHTFVEAEPLDDERYRANGEDRCYRCRSVETRALRAVGEQAGARQFLDGLHRDDLGDDRPGIRAMEESGFTHPLIWAGWAKPEVRRYAADSGLPNAARPSNACLASRVARGEPISRELLGRIERAERLLLEQGFVRVRVRVRGGAARVEVDRTEVDRLEDPTLRTELTRTIRELGFVSVAFDPHGYTARELLPTVR